MEAIGKVLNIDFEALAEWRRARTYEQALKEIWTDWGYSKQFLIPDHSSSSEGYTRLTLKPDYYGKIDEEAKQARFEKALCELIAELQQVFAYSQKYNNPIKVYISDERFTLIGWGVQFETLPTCCLSFEKYQTYEDLPLLEVQQRLLGTDSGNYEVSADGKSLTLSNGKTIPNVSKQDLEALKKQKEEEIQLLNNQLQTEVEKIRKEAELKEQELKLKMSEAMAALQTKKKEMEVQIFNLDRQLYLLRCLLGDAVDIAHLRKGENAPKEQPVILYQKLRFLDEDFAEIKTLYGYCCDDEKRVEEILATDDFVLNQFCPTNKGIVLLKVSRENHYYANNHSRDMLELYHYSNGNRIAILVRNGENVYLAWTEADRIIIKENFMLSERGTYQIEANETIHIDEDTITNADYTNKSDLAWRQYFSREFLFSILQGFIQYKQIIDFPERVFIGAQSRYVIFSTADTALEDNRFGDLSQYMKKRNHHSARLDYILPTRTITGSHTEKAFWGNGYEEVHRSHGKKNRTRNCDIPAEVCQINLREQILQDRIWLQRASGEGEPDERDLERDAEYQRVLPLLEAAEEQVGVIDAEVWEGLVQYTFSIRDAGAHYTWKSNNQRYRKEEGFIIKRVYIDDYRYYISVAKPEEWNSHRSAGKDVRSNVQIDEEEFINLTYLCSDVLTYFIETKKVGTHISGNYAYIVEYLNKAKVFIKSREEEMYALLSSLSHKDISKIPYISFLLAEWRYRNKVRDLGKVQAKRFLKYLDDLDDVEQEYQRLVDGADWKKGE